IPAIALHVRDACARKEDGPLAPCIKSGTSRASRSIACQDGKKHGSGAAGRARYRVPELVPGPPSPLRPRTAGPRLATSPPSNLRGHHGEAERAVGPATYSEATAMARLPDGLGV